VRAIDNAWTELIPYVRRWFVLTLSSLEYYKNNTKKKKKGEFLLQGATVRQSLNKFANLTLARILSADRSL
jgi:hypothetical protein